MSEETTDKVVMMKDEAGRVIGFELLHYRPAQPATPLTVEMVAKRAVIGTTRPHTANCCTHTKKR